jgi:chromosome segregation ATPase
MLERAPASITDALAKITD